MIFILKMSVIRHERSIKHQIVFITFVF